MLSTVAPPHETRKNSQPDTAAPRAQKPGDPSYEQGHATCKPRSWRRVNRARETDEPTIRAAIPQGFTRPYRARDVLDVIEMHPRWATLYKTRRTGLKAVLEAMVRVTDYDTMTTRPTWDYIIDRTGIPRSTMTRHLATLRSWGLVATVATGRSAAYAATGPDGEKINEAAVYVLCIPRRFASHRPPRKLPVHCAPRPVIHKARVHENGTPPAVGDYLGLREETTHARAREEALAETATRSAMYSGGRWAAALTRYPHHRQVILWSPHQRTASKKQRQRAAAELKRRYPAIFRRSSAADIASTFRSHLKAGWNVKDLAHALEFQPDGTRWPHTCSPGSTDPWCVRGWLTYRITHWTTADGEPLTSPSQRQASERAQAAAQQRRREEEAQQRHQHRAAPRSLRKATALARIKSVLRPGAA